MKTLLTIITAISTFFSGLFITPTTLHWIPNKEPYVNIALIRQISSDPAKYTFIKMIASSTPNTGEYKVFPLRGLYEIECVPSPRACESQIATSS